MSDSKKNILASCYVMPLLDSSSSIDENLRIKANNALQYNSLHGNQKVNFNFHKVYSDLQDFQRTSFNTSIAPMVKQTLAGESTVVIFSGMHNQRMSSSTLGSQSQAIHHSVSTQNFVQSIISEAAGHLTNSVITGGENNPQKTGSVTFSWYTVECQPGIATNEHTSEHITDILKTASNSGAGHGHESTLMLRELGKGRGIFVPGLWEVEVASGADVDSVITHVQKMIPQVASYNNVTGSNQHYHTVMQLTVTNKAKAGAQGAPSPANKTTMISDPPGVGRLTFLMLANIATSHLPSSPSRQQQQHMHPEIHIAPWAESVHNVINWVESKRVSPPFHKSRLLLILKDVLCGRQSASVLLFVQPTKEHHELNFEWFRLISRLTKDDDQSALSAAASAGPFAATNSNTHHLNTTAATPSLTSRSGSSRDLSLSQAPTVNLHSAPGGASAVTPNRSVASAGLRSSSAPVTGRTDGGKLQPGHLDMSSQFAAGKMQFLDEEVKIRPTSAKAGAGAGNSPTNSVGSVGKRPFSAGGGAASANAGGGDPFASHRGRLSAGGYNNAASSTAAAAAGMANAGLNQSPGSVHPILSADDMDGLLPSNNHSLSDAKHRETEAALVLALEASRNEAAALKIAYNYSNEKYAETKAAYDNLIEQLKEQGAMLTKRDRERFKNALKDIKDYEIYKEVMEAAMTQLQKQLEMYAQENQELKENKAHEGKVAKKHKSFNENYSKDLVATKKKLAELEATFADTLKQNKHLVKERDHAVNHLTTVKTNAHNKVAQLQASNDERQKEIEELRRQLQAAEERVRVLEGEKETVVAAHQQEVSHLKNAHNKALEMLMTYQEENDTLRNAMSDMSLEVHSSSNFGSPAPAAPPSAEHRHTD